MLASASAACSDSSDNSVPTLATAVAPAFSGTSEPDTTATTAPRATTSTTLPQRSNPGEANGDLTLGYLLASTGELASFSAPLIIAVQMAVADAQAAGFQDVVLVGADTASSAEAISSEFDGLLVQGADGIVGASSSALTTIIVPKAKESQTVLISPSATSVTLTEADDDGYFFRTAPSDVYWGKVLADRVATYGGQRTAIVYRNDIFGSSLDKDFRPAQVPVFSQALAQLALFGWQRSRHSSHGVSVISQRAVGDPCQQSRVHSAAERHHYALVLFQVVMKIAELFHNSFMLSAIPQAERPASSGFRLWPGPRTDRRSCS